MTNLEGFDKTIVKLAKTWNIPPLEWEDIAQELRIHLWLKEKSAKEPIKNYNDWAYITCRNKIKDLHKYYTCQKRDTFIVNLEELQENGLDINTEKKIVSKSSLNPNLKCRL